VDDVLLSRNGCPIRLCSNAPSILVACALRREHPKPCDSCGRASDKQQNQCTYVAPIFILYEFRIKEDKIALTGSQIVEHRFHATLIVSIKHKHYHTYLFKRGAEWNR